MTPNKMLAAAFALVAATILFFFTMRRVSSSTPSAATAKTSELQKQWEFQAGGAIKGALALDTDSNTLYAASEDGYLYALDLSGALRWKTQVGPSFSAPAVGPDGAVYIANNNGRVLAVNRSGVIRWSSDVYEGNTFGQNGSAIGSNDLYAPARGTLSALRLSDGHVDWTTIGGEQWGSVTLLSDGTVLSPGRGRLNALDSGGALLWQMPSLAAEQIKTNGSFVPPVDFFVNSGIAVTSDRTLLMAVDRTRMVALGLDGTQKWELPARSGALNRGTPVIATDGTIYFVSGAGVLYAVDPSGTQRWSLTLPDAVSTTPILTEDGTIFVLSSVYLFAVSPQGQLIAQAQSSDGSESSPTIASDGTIFTATSLGKVRAYTGGHGGLMNSPCPKYQFDAANSGVAHQP
jgi:outer membrane protein assembly factor BamB